MAWFVLARLLFVAAVVYTAALLQPLRGGLAINVAFGFGLAAVFIAFEVRLKHTSITHMLGAMLGGALGLVAAKALGAALFWANPSDDRVAFLHAFILLALPYLGLVLGGRRGEWLEPARLIGLFRSAGPQRRYRILDTSVIIDGRIADVCETGFLDGTLVIPQFVLKELQLVADSADSLKRNRGRRGLDILQKIQKMSGLEVTISDLDFPEVREVDLKLIELARALQGKIVTNDFNLNKVAQLRGVQVLNINELANSLKPVVLPGEIMRVFILKEGKEYNQGVAYLDDGTMVVVDNARKLIGKTVDVVVTSVLQTTAGKMIFGRFVDPSIAAAQAAEREEGRRPRTVPASAASASGGGSAPAQSGSGGGSGSGAPAAVRANGVADGPVRG
ncbi:MAG TPA: PIN domain-containing protein [Vicinamibacterales bacterium]